MKKGLFLLLFFAVLSVLGCDKDAEKNELRGDINVNVIMDGFSAVENASVYTNPPSAQGITDEFGSVLLTDIEIGSYEVFANLPNVGSGKSTVNVKANDLVSVTVNIIPGTNVGLAPIITIILPTQPAEFSTGEEIMFSINVEDDNTQSQDIQIAWGSNLDGILGSSSPDANGNLSFSTNSLSGGIHQITITAEDSDGYSTSASIEVNTLAINAVVLSEPTKNEGKVNLEWTEYSDNDFSKYEIYRANGNCEELGQELLATITDQGTTNYTDELPPLEFQACYFVKVFNNENNSRTSNQETIDSPSGHIFNFEAYDMLKHPTQDFVYLIDRGGQRIVKFDYINSVIVDETEVSGEMGHCDIGDNGFGVEIYVPTDGNFIYVYDADNLNQTTAINVGLEITSVVVNGLGHVIAAVLPSPWWEQPVRTYLRSSGINIDGNGDFDGDRLRMIPGENEIISISTGVSPTDMEYFELGSNGNITNHQDDQYHGDHPLDAKIFRISDDGTYSITSKHGAVYTANSAMEYKGQLESGALDFSDFAFSDDGSIIYAATSNRKSIQIGNYPSLMRSDEILTRGFPVFIIRAGDKIISLSKPTEDSINTGIEIIQL